MHGSNLVLKSSSTCQDREMAERLGLVDDCLTEAQINLVQALERHRAAELDVKDVDQTLATMVDEPYLLFVASMTGGTGKNGVKHFYTEMIRQLPVDLEWELISRTVGTSQIVIESIMKFTHNLVVDWLIPGVDLTNKKLEIPIVLIFTFDKGTLASERIYWDQASVLQQLGLLEKSSLPIVGCEAAVRLRKLTIGLDNV